MLQSDVGTVKAFGIGYFCKGKSAGLRQGTYRYVIIHDAYSVVEVSPRLSQHVNLVATYAI